MSRNFTEPSPFEVLGLLAHEPLEAIERRAEALEGMGRLGVSTNEDAAIANDAATQLDPQAVSEAARSLRNPVEWLQEILFWPHGNLHQQALTLAADLLEGGAGQSAEPGALARQLAQEYLAAETAGQQATDQPERLVSSQLAPPNEPPLYLGPRPASSAEHKEDSDG
jgi:hypothetical protein